jgi:hypothetical protein
MARPRTMPKITIVIAWNLQELLATRVLSPGESEWKLAEELLDAYPEASHIRFYGEVNSLTRTERLDEVHRLEVAQEGA